MSFRKKQLQKRQQQRLNKVSPDHGQTAISKQEDGLEKVTVEAPPSTKKWISASDEVNPDHHLVIAEDH